MKSIWCIYLAFVDPSGWMGLCTPTRWRPQLLNEILTRNYFALASTTRRKLYDREDPAVPIWRTKETAHDKRRSFNCRRSFKSNRKLVDEKERSLYRRKTRFNKLLLQLSTPQVSFSFVNSAEKMPQKRTSKLKVKNLIWRIIHLKCNASHHTTNNFKCFKTN